MKYLLLLIPIMCIVVFWATKTKELVLVNGNFLLSSSHLIYSFLFVNLFLPAITFFFEKSSVFIIRSYFMVLCVCAISFIFYLVLIYLMYWLPDSLFYRPRRWLSFKSDVGPEVGATVLYPIAFGFFLTTFYMINFITLLGIFVSPLIKDSK